MKDIHNILVTAVGSMSAASVLETLNAERNVRAFACDINPKEHLVLAGRFEKFYQTPRATADSYIDEIIGICLENNIHIIFPLTDPEVDRLTEAEALFQSYDIVIAAPGFQTVSLCRDKMNFYKKLNATPGINLIPTYNDKEILIQEVTYPLVAKPAKGRSSEGLFKVNDSELLHYIVKEYDDYVFQKMIAGCIITVDVAKDKKGNFFALARKELLRTSNGAGLTVGIEENEFLFETARQICNVLDIEGCINMEFIFDGADYWLMDINPRFSAGIGFSKLAGYDFVKQCLNIFTGNEIDVPNGIQYGFYGKIYDDHKIV